MICGDGLVGLLCNAFVPTVGLGQRLVEFWAHLQTRFPFSLAGSLNFGEAVGGGGYAALPPMVGWLPLYQPLLGDIMAVARAAITVLIFVKVVWFLVDRFTPQTTI